MNAINWKKLLLPNISFASVHAIVPFHSEGLGHFPTSNF